MPCGEGQKANSPHPGGALDNMWPPSALESAGAWRGPQGACGTHPYHGHAVPVVGYDVPGVRDALSHFGRGVLVPEADGPAGLVGALVALRGDDAARQELVSRQDF